METSLDYRPAGADPLAPDTADPMRTLRGHTIAFMVRQLVDASNSTDKKPREAIEQHTDSVLALEGKAYSSLTHTIDTAGNTTILPGGKSDSSISFELHDTTLAHLLGVGLEPSVIARRGKSAMADALTELAAIRWQLTGMENTAERLITDARLRGTCGAKTFRDPAIGLARTTWIPTRHLVIDPASDGDLERTKFRGERTFVYRSDLRRMLEAWGKDPALAEQAGMDIAFDEHREDPKHLLRRELEKVAVIDFYWQDGGFRRHIILVQGIDEPVWDVDRWPYELPPGRWPINVFQWNPMPNTPWGRSDFGLVQLWEESISWMQRFLIDSAAEAAKVVPVFDRSIGDLDTVQKIFGDLRRSYEACPLNLSQIVLGDMDLKKLVDFLNVPTSVDKIQVAAQFSREIIGRALGLDEMIGKLEQPGINPPRLARRMARWRKFLAGILEAESCVDMTTIPRRALIAVRKPANDPVTGANITELARYAYVDLKKAEALEKNTVAHATRRQLTAEQWDPAAKQEAELRLVDGIDNESVILIKEPGIARFVSRKHLVDYWEGAIPGVAMRSTYEYSFHVDIIGSLESSDQAANRSSAAMQQLLQVYNQWGMQEAAFAWSDQYQKAVDKNNALESAGRQPGPVPQPPKMLTNLILLHQDFVRAVGSKDARSLSLRPEDLATALAQGKAMQDAQMEAQAAAAQPPAEDPRKMELEVAKLQLEVERLALQKQKTEAEVQVEQIQAQTELLRQQHEVLKQKVEEQRMQLEHQREMAEMPFRMAQTQARTDSTIAQRDRALATAAAEVARSQQQESQAEIQAAVAIAEAELKSMKAELTRVQAEKLIAEHNARANNPPDTKEAKEIAEAQALIAKVKEAEQRIENLKAEEDKARATAEKERAQAKLIRKTPPAPPRSSGGKKK